MLTDRRTVLAGIAGLAIGGSATAQPDSPVAHGVLANNALALDFIAAPSLPSVTLVGLDGEHLISDFKGKTILMPLWAEWCTPCLSELGDFARLQQKFGNSKFAIVPVLTGAQRQMTPQAIAGLLDYLHAGNFEPLVEKNFGRTLMDRMGRRNNEIEIPCNILFAPDGSVVGRQFGTHQTESDATVSEAEKALMAKGESETLARAQSGEILSLWGKAPGVQFAAAMADGFLDHG
jgi:thiol-disulfide isomerase/thioredoxin